MPEGGHVRLLLLMLLLRVVVGFARRSRVQPEKSARLLEIHQEAHIFVLGAGLKNSSMYFKHSDSVFSPEFENSFKVMKENLKM